VSFQDVRFEVIGYFVGKGGKIKPNGSGGLHKPFLRLAYKGSGKLVALHSFYASP
jgi:hypothetical protein